MPLNLTELKKIINKAFRQTVDEFVVELRRQLETVKWEWDGTITVRRSGQVVVSPRDIVDTGKLRDSLMVIENNPKFYDLIYDTIYAELVHEGYTTSSGKQKPARPWVETAVRESDLKAVFIQKLQALL